MGKSYSKAGFFMLLEATNVCKHFDGIKAVDGVDFMIKKGQIKSIIGPNGAGKTTFFNLVAGLFHPTAGQITYRGRNITNRKIHQRTRLGITKTFQITHIFPELSVYENVRVAAQSKQTQFNFWGRVPRLKEVDRISCEILENIGLQASSDRPAAELSHGEKRYLEIGLLLLQQDLALGIDRRHEPLGNLGCQSLYQTYLRGFEAYDHVNRA